MIPSALAAQLQQGLADFLRYSFWSSTPGMEHLIEDLLATPGALVKGPYISIKLPFATGKDPRYFPEVPLSFTPHAHQERAFERLGGRRKRSTLIATGTGSGKTECFLLPILDHCRENRGAGIKAILIYPMNALATDQAVRIARLIHQTPKLKGVRAGLYIGETERSTRETKMGPRQVITDRATMQSEPPDILLTNYKMLDYLLLRPGDQGIWQRNDRGVLRFVVVDELHTFDGAQGTDLACLIRRLKRRLQVDDGSLCCVGTSATLGGPRAADDLRRYAEQVFGEPFDENSIVGEARISAEQFLAGAEVEHTEEPDAGDLEELDPARAEDPDEWLETQARLWLGNVLEGEAGDEWKVSLGQHLRRHATFQSLLRLVEGGVQGFDDALQALARRRSSWRRQPELGRAALGSLLGLISAARVFRPELPQVKQGREKRGEPRPVDRFLDVRLQVWQREMSRMVASVEARPRLAFSDDLDRDQKRRHLPIVHCRDCGAMGWAARRDRDKRHVLRTDLSSFYRAFFSNDSRVSFLFPRAACAGWETAEALRVETRTLVALGKDEDPDGEIVELVASENTRHTDKGTFLHRDCPFCGAQESLTILGFQAATLTSTYIDQLFASPFNDDKKLLAFSDSVQDAAHRAGFFGARTWRTNLRLAMQTAIEEISEGERLSELATDVERYWREEWDDRQWVATFLPPNLSWLHDWDALRTTGKLAEDSELYDLISKRLTWEAANEYGLQASIGRSLPRSRASTVYLDPEALERAVRSLEEPLRNEVAGLRGVKQDEIRAFVLGLLHHLRLRGAIHHPEVPTDYLESGGRAYVFKLLKHLPSFGPTSRLPAFLVDRGGTARFDTWTSSAGAKIGWYQRWAERSFSREAALGVDASSLYLTALPRLVAAGLLWEGSGKRGERIWGVVDSSLLLTARVMGVRCNLCGHRLPVAEDEVSRWEGVPCLTACCEGRFERDASALPEYFSRLYRSGDLQRIYAEEHTGLLTRVEREQVEEQFKASEMRPFDTEGTVNPATGALWREPWFPNLLSCTPTLEMGIDIGDLSAAVLCSVPPKQANYLQRVGRAGRRDGNSLILAVATSRPHDLYFYASPTEMLEGEVTPPGVFLDAAAVLERQLAAFCLDRWVADPAQRAKLPDTMREIFPHLTKGKADHFPQSWLTFVEEREPTLLREFFEMFGENLTEETRQYLRDYLRGSAEGQAGLRWKILDTLQSERKQRESLKQQAERAQKEIKRLEELEAKPLDIEEQLLKLEEEKEALVALVRQIDHRRVLELLTDAGFLPNYAFPEAQVRLSSVIWRRKKKAPAGGGSKYETWTHEYRRSPGAALAELAPSTDFYAGGRRVAIDQVDLGISEVETWRFCDACSHAQRIATAEDPESCPACGSSTWRDEGQKLRLLPLRQVFARSSDKESRIRDEQEERQPRFFQRELLVDFRKEDRESAWRIGERSLPFGFEYLKRATFRDVNFGEIEDHGTKNTIAGREAVRTGFEICGRCGKVQRPRRPREHTLSCPTRTQHAAEQIEPCLYLYREFSSEALRILLPVTDLGTQGELHSFVAAFQVGLEAKFRGNVDHLRSTVCSEPSPGSSLRKQVLVLYDTVPGGTGYLKQLVTEDSESGELPFFEVLELARKRLQSCVCWNDPERHGCYRCLFGYRNSRDMDDVSSRAAVDLISRILAHQGTIERVGSLGEVSISGLLDSVLEARFLEALRQAKANGRAAELVPSIARGKAGYTLVLGASEWAIEPQVEVSQASLGVTVSIDFVLHPRQSPGAPARRPIAVFLDGWEYHRERIGWDLFQRQLLIASGQYDVWSLTWGDLEAAFYPDRPDEAKNLVHPELQRVRDLLQRMGLAAHKEIAERKLFEVFVTTLASATELPWEEIGRGVIASRMEPAPAGAGATWKSTIHEHAAAALRPVLVVEAPKLVAVDSGELDDAVRVYAAFDGQQPIVLAILDDSPERCEQPGFNKTWNGFLHLYQLLRFLPGAWFMTRSEADTLPWHHLLVRRCGAPDEEEAAWDGLGEVSEPFVSLWRALMEAGAPQPEVGLDIPDDRGQIWGEAELVWTAAKVAVVDRSRMDEARRPLADGWRLFVLEDLGGQPGQILEAVGGTR